MTVLTYRGKKYIQNKEVPQFESPVVLKYRGLEVMSKRIHEAISAELGWLINQFFTLKMSQLRLIFFCRQLFLKKARKNKRSKTNIYREKFRNKEFLKKFFDLCKENQEQIPSHKIAEVLRD